MGKIAYIFPGQGSQQVGMGFELFQSWDIAKKVYQEADEILHYPLSQICFEGPEEQLRLTANTQPAILVTSIACYRLLEETGIKADFVAGHSLGEYSALVSNGSISFADAVKTVHHRGVYMEEAVPHGVGAMAAILNLDRQKLIEICREVTKEGHVADPANFNCPGQIVISGHKEAVQEACEMALEAGARRVIPLSVSGPFHSSLMKSAATKLSSYLEKISIHDAQIPLVTNVSAEAIQSKQEILSSLIKQVYSPVLWEDSVQFMLNQGVDTFIEIGNGNVLTGLIRKMDSTVKALSIQNLQTLENTLSYLCVKRG